jgi:hypothetical protein
VANALLVAQTIPKASATLRFLFLKLAQLSGWAFAKVAVAQYLSYTFEERTL